MIKYVEVTIAERPTADYPFAVVLRNAAPERPFGKHDSQEHMVRSVRDGLIFGNGMIAGLMAIGALTAEDDHNVRYDPRIKV